MKRAEIEVEFFLNMQMIVDDLADDFNVSYYQQKDNPEKLSASEIYYGQHTLRRDTLYVASSEVFEQHPIKDKKICRVLVGPTDTASGMEEYPLIVVKGVVNWQEIYNRIQKSFNRYISWHHRLMSIVDGGGGLYELCVAGIDFFKNPLYIHDENFNILAMPMWVVGMTGVAVDENNGNVSVSLRTLTKIRKNKEYQKTLSMKRAAMWNPKNSSHRVLYVNIWGENEKYCGRVLIQELNTTFKPSDFRMAEHFGKILSLAFERDFFKTNSVTSFEEVLKDVYSGRAYEEAYLSNRMKMVDWEMGHDFICFATVASVNRNSIITLKRVCSTISILLKSIFSFSVGDVAYSVCDLNLAGVDIYTCRNKLEELSESLDTRSGVSMVFHDLRRLPDYCRQAEKALDFVKFGTKDPVILFSDNVLKYIISHFEEEFSADMVAFEGVEKLSVYDKENDTRYLETLKLYLENGMQQTLTANELFIHRSTLIYRIKKIEEMLNIDLSDPEIRLYIQISIKLLER